MSQWIGEIIIGAGLVIIAIGFIGIFRFRSFYGRLLLSSVIDTMGFLTVLIGVIVRQGLSFFSLKVLLLLVIVLLIGPVTTHKIGRSAWLSGYQVVQNDDDPS